MRMSISRYACLVVFGLLTSLSMQAQFLDYGSDPARVQMEHCQVAPIITWCIRRVTIRWLITTPSIWKMLIRILQKTIRTGMQKKFPVILHPANMSSTDWYRGRLAVWN